VSELNKGELGDNGHGMLENLGILVTGGTGSLGKVLVRRILGNEWGRPRFVRVLSRDEGKQHKMRIAFSKLAQSEEEGGLVYRAIAGSDGPLQFVIGDVRDKDTLVRALRGVAVVFNAAALKQVPSCEYFPWEAVRTNVGGANALVQAVIESFPRPRAVIGISTDKACKPVNVMGMTKAIQERIWQKANLDCPEVRFVAVRYGNVLASRGSVIPLFLHQIAKGGPVTVTSKEMTRFFLTLDRAVDTVMFALEKGMPGDTIIPRVPSASIFYLADEMVAALAGGPGGVEIKETEVRPGEKLHEELISAEEVSRTVTDGPDYYAIRSVLPEVRDLSGSILRVRPVAKFPHGAYSSKNGLLHRTEVRELLAKHRLLDPALAEAEEVLR
jgi:UDP-glucose 4-epimerase